MRRHILAPLALLTFACSSGVSKASTGEEESRYSQRTMVDIRDNLAGTKDVTVTGDAIPQLPATRTNESPNTPADLATPFGKLFTSVNTAVDPNVQGSAVYEMNLAAVALGYSEFVNP